MKQIITTSLPPPPVVELDKLNSYELIGLEAFDSLSPSSSGRVGKYALSMTTAGEAIFARGLVHWATRSTKKELLRHCIDDKRCKVFAFDDIVEFGKWLAS